MLNTLAVRILEQLRKELHPARRSNVHEYLYFDIRSQMALSILHRCKGGHFLDQIEQMC